MAQYQQPSEILHRMQSEKRHNRKCCPPAFYQPFLAQRRVSLLTSHAGHFPARRVFHSLLSCRAKPSQRSIRVAIWHSGLAFGSCIYCACIERDAPDETGIFRVCNSDLEEIIYGFDYNRNLTLFTRNEIDLIVAMHLILFLIQFLWIVFFYNKLKMNILRNGATLRFNLILKNWLYIVLFFFC